MRSQPHHWQLLIKPSASYVLLCVVLCQITKSYFIIIANMLHEKMDSARHLQLLLFFTQPDKIIDAAQHTIHYGKVYTITANGGRDHANNEYLFNKRTYANSSTKSCKWNV